MCGITGIFSLSGHPVIDAERRIKRMTSLLQHRGPDSLGTYLSPDGLAALGHTRLAIVDPSCQIMQPLESRDRKAVLAYNGEIYNYLEIMEEMKSRGVNFRTKMDTEVLLEGLRSEGEGFLKRLDGMWAFAYYDTAKRRLLLSRDILGERHLFYFIDKDELIFSSEARPIIAGANGRHFEIDFNSFATALQYFAAPPGRTMVKGISRMLPGHNIIAEPNGSFRQYRYRRLHPEKWFDFFDKDPSMDEAIEVFEKTFHGVCKRRLSRDVPYICTLSGGLDSALICLYASDFGKTKIRTLYGQSAAKPSQNLKDEMDEYAASVFTSEKLSTLHDHIHLNTDEAVPILQRLAGYAFDGMFDNGVASFQMLGMNLKARNYKVILISEGPDELLGYPKDLRAYKIDSIFKNNRVGFYLLRALSWAKTGQDILRSMHRQDLIMSPLFSYAPFRFLPIHESWGYYRMTKILDEKLIFGTASYYGVIDSAYKEIISDMDFTQMRALSYASLSLPDMFNLRTDKAYMAASVEARLPYQAPEMVELLIAMPARFRFNNGDTTKYLMRKIVERRIGPEIAGRSKHGFGEPIWLSPNIYEKMNYEETVRESPIFEDFPFKKGARDLILNPENRDMLWPFFALVRTRENLRKESANVE